MNEKTIEKQLSEIFENILRDFFAKTIQERLEQAKNHFEKIEIGQRIAGRFVPFGEVRFPELKIVVERVAAYLEAGYVGERRSEHEELILKLQDRKLQNYFIHKWQEVFSLLTPLFLATFYLFDETGSSLLSQELREELLRESGLDTAPKRRDACLKYLAQLLLDATVKHGGSEGFWNKERRRLLLTNYNRFGFVIKNALNDITQLRRKKMPEAKIREKIREKYMIPQECIQDIFMRISKADLASKWAKRELKSDAESLARVLAEARKENKVTMKHGKPTLLVDFFEDENGIYNFTADPKQKNEKLKYISPYTLNPPKPVEVVEAP